VTGFRPMCCRRPSSHHSPASSPTRTLLRGAIERHRGRRLLPDRTTKISSARSRRRFARPRRSSAISLRLRQDGARGAVREACPQAGREFRGVAHPPQRTARHHRRPRIATGHRMLGTLELLREEVAHLLDPSIDASVHKIMLKRFVQEIRIEGRQSILPLFRIPQDRVRVVKGLVPAAGLEPATKGLRVPCSTN
jgi:hypothetical protein